MNVIRINQVCIGFRGGSKIFQFSITTILSVVVHFLGAVAFLIVFMFIIPQFAMMFADMGRELPGITQFMIDLSEWIQAFFLFLLFPAIFLFILDVVLLFFLKKYSKMILIASIFAVLGGIVFVAFALYLPIFTMAV